MKNLPPLCHYWARWSIQSLLYPRHLRIPDQANQTCQQQRIQRQRKLLAPDAFRNPEHLQFALKGCLAASVCYVIYNAIAWPGISTAVTTCLLTALSTIGSSRQKQLLRITGAVVGGFLVGMGSQIFILPYLDSIAGFVVLFVAVTALSSWFMTSSPRLSYFGIQVALAFFLVNVSEFKMQTSLAVARDRVVGILLGLFIMWLVFDQLWGAPAAIEMRRTFISNLRLLAQLAREPLSQDRKTAIARSLALGETINANLDKVRALADGVLFEFGPSREQDLALRDRIRQWQPNLRMLFITRIVLWRYRAGLPGFELPEAMQPAQQKFDNRLATALDGMADRMDGKASTAIGRFDNGLCPTRTSGMEGCHRNSNISRHRCSRFSFSRAELQTWQTAWKGTFKGRAPRRDRRITVSHRLRRRWERVGVLWQAKRVRGYTLVNWLTLSSSL